jgi:Tfp pilus assembly protein PilZ
MTEPTDERRRDPRYTARLVVRFAKPQDAARAFEAFSMNLSAGGLCLRSTVRHELGETLRIELDAGPDQLSLDAVVAWVRRDTMGVRFVNVRLPVRERLEALVERLRHER